MNNFFDTLISILKADERYFSVDGELLRNAVYEDAMRPAPSLIRLLLSDTETKARFFTEIDGTFIFDKAGFAWVIANRELLPDSYTRFKNKIGLADERGELTVDSGKIELVFPYKDCILEGGQTKEDQKRQEIFYNETLAPDEVDYLLYPKALCKAVRHTASGSESATEISDTDNLIIKGNNLLALASLLKRCENRVQLVNIDPPYNTGNDSFGYNDKFNHSTWLVFMKNRLELAKRLLKPSGFLCCQVNESESYYLKVLLDELFGRENYLATLFIKVRYAEKTLKQDMDFHKEIEQILVYRVSANSKPIFDTIELGLDKYVYYVRELGEYETITLGGKRVDVFRKGAFEIIEDAPTVNGLKEIWASGTILDGNSSGRFFRDYLTGRSDVDGLGTLYKVYGIGDDSLDYRYFTGPQRGNATKGKYYQGVPTSQLNGSSTTEVPINSFYDLSANFGNCRHEGGVELRSGKKPEALHQILLNHFTRQGDIVLDFFAGSGTAGAVAHKTGRQYILIEQLGYIHDLPESRLINVIKGDQTGISKAVNWQGGGSFIYCELAEQNQAFANRIQAADDTDTLLALWEEIKSSGYYSYKVDVREVAANIQDFVVLSLDNQKHFLMEVLDKNLLYVNYCDMTDIDFADTLTVEDKAFSKSFYKED